MSDQGSITVWLQGLQAGDSVAAQQIWNRFSERLLRLVNRKLRSSRQRVADGEDVVACAFDSLFRRAGKGEFSQLENRDDLWRLLVTIADRKASNLRRDQHRLKRGGGRVGGDSALPRADSSGAGGWNNIAGEEPTPEFVASMTETLDALMDQLDEALRQTVLYKLEGMTNDEIASRIGRSRVTVERQLKKIRTIWSDWGNANGSL